MLYRIFSDISTYHKSSKRKGMKMHTATTEGVKISVSTLFRPDFSNIGESTFYYHYKIHIENRNNFPIKLLKRQWHIYDSLNPFRLVEGEGVIGNQPELQPGEIFTYTSGCDLHSEIGYMHGYYTFKNLLTGENFRVTVPQFDLVFPGKYN
jgi:ApaG protein